jgi:hypothetical protein
MGVAPAFCGKQRWGSARVSRALPGIVRAGATKDNEREHEYEHEHEHEDEASAGDEWAEGVPSFTPFGFALPKFRFEISKIIGEAFHPVQRL